MPSNQSVYGKYLNHAKTHLSILRITTKCHAKYFARKIFRSNACDRCKFYTFFFVVSYLNPICPQFDMGLCSFCIRQLYLFVVQFISSDLRNKIIGNTCYVQTSISIDLHVIRMIATCTYAIDVTFGFTCSFFRNKDQRLNCVLRFTL